VLHDRLLGMFEDDAELRPEDVLVMVPEISRYAPYIEAVFDVEQEGGRPFIPWNLSDISVRDEHPVVQVFLRLLALPESRFSLSEVLSYLDVPEVASRFGLDADAIARVKDWIDRANPRWGLDAAHKERLGLPGVVENTWAQAEQRLFAGYAVGDLGAFDGIVPLGGIEGAQADALGRFWHLLGTLSGAAERLAEPRSAVDWQRTIGALIDDLFGEREDEDGRLQRIRDAIAELAEQASGLDEALAPELVRRWLERRLGAVGRHGRYFSGGVTFCGMRPMRSLPFAVICVLGLQDQAFPRRERPADFDRMRRDWQPGDARAGDEDRYLFLETLLCARRRLYLSYVGRDSRRGSERQPSVLLRELLDYIDQQYRVAGGDEKARLSDRLTTVHPLQPFSLRNFTTGEGGYDADWCAVARDLRREDAWQTGPTSGWNGACLAEMPERTREIALVQLARFVRHPVRHFVHTRLRVFLRDDDPDEDDEIFSLDGLQRFVLRQRVVEEYMRGRALSPRWLSAEGALPHGAFAGLALERAERETAPLLQRLQPYLDDRPRSVPVALELAGVADPLQVCGRIDGIYPGPGLMRWRPGRLTGGDLLGLWIGHLAWCAVEPSGAKQSALHTADGSFVVDDTLDPEAARAALGRYLALYWQGLHRPLPVLPKASYAFALKRVQGGRGDPLREAYRAWNGSPFNGVPGDRDDVYIQFAMRGTSGDPVATDEFAVLAGELYGQALASGELL
jgi:exodeoxyribonuclease V gamma subunit